MAIMTKWVLVTVSNSMGQQQPTRAKTCLHLCVISEKRAVKAEGGGGVVVGVMSLCAEASSPLRNLESGPTQRNLL